MTPEQIAEAHPLVLKLTEITKERNAASLMRNSPAEKGKDTGGCLNLRGAESSGFNLFYLQDEEFTEVQRSILSILDSRIDRIQAQLTELGVDL